MYAFMVECWHEVIITVMRRILTVMMEIMVRTKVMVVAMIMISLLIKFNIFNLRCQLVDQPSQRFTKDCASGRVWGEGDDVIIISVRTVWGECEIT